MLAVHFYNVDDLSFKTLICYTPIQSNIGILIEIKVFISYKRYFLSTQLAKQSSFKNIWLHNQMTTTMVHYIFINELMFNNMWHWEMFVVRVLDCLRCSLFVWRAYPFQRQLRLTINWTILTPLYLICRPTLYLCQQNDCRPFWNSALLTHE